MVLFWSDRVPDTLTRKIL